MPNRPLARDRSTGLVRPHPAMPGRGAPTAGVHLLDLLSEPDDPPSRLAPDRDRDRDRDRVTMILAGVASAVATAALGVAVLTWMSVSSLETVAAAGGGPTTTASATGHEEVASAAQQPLGPALAGPGAASPLGALSGSTYSPAYPAQSLQLSLPPCMAGLARYVDLDEPRVDPDASRADLYYQPRSGCYGTPQLNLIGAVAASVVTRPTLRPAQCVDDIRNAPANSPILLDHAMNICVLTSRDAAVGQGISQKVAMLAISAPTPDGAVTMRVTAWQITP